MTERTSGVGDQSPAGGRRAAQGTDGRAGGPGGDRKAGQRRRSGPPIWLFIVAGVLVIALAVVLVIVLGNRGGEPEPLPAETTTLDPPTPTIEPMTREPGTAFYDALPSEVLQYALTESAPDETWFPDAALEGYRLVYSDGGGTELVVLTAQWRDAEGAQEVFDRLTADQPPVGTEVGGASGSTGDDAAADDETADGAAAEEATDDEATTDDGDAAPPTVQGGSVQVDGTDVGEYLIVPHADGSGTAWWTNGTVLFQVDGPASALPDFYTAYPL